MTTIIQMTEPEDLPTLAYWKICAWKFEVPRPQLQKAGHITIWLAKCWKNGGDYQESNGPGMMIEIKDAEFDEFITVPTTLQGLMDDSIQILGQFLIDKGYISGTVIEED